MMSHTRKTTTALAALAAGGSLLLAACGGGATPALGSGAGGGSGTGTTVWAVQSAQSDSYLAAADRWNAANPDRPVDVQLMPDKGYMDKVRVALGAGEGPTLMFSWGGGGLKSYVDKGYVDPLTEHDELVDRYLPAALGKAVFDGEVYGVPINNMQPVVILYNKDVFAAAGVEVPTTWDELEDVVSALDDAGVAPFALAGQSKWPQLPYLAYLVDRLGGPEVFEKIVDNEPGSWSDPAVLGAVTMIQELVDSGGFADDFSSTAYETGAADALLYTGKAGMILMLSQAYSNIATAAPDVVGSGTIGYFPFPEVEGGTGDPRNLVGNPSNYWSVTADASDEDKTTAIDFLTEEVMNETYVGEILDRSAVPGVTSVGAALASRDQPFSSFVADLVKDAPEFQLSWNQALSPAQGDELSTQLDRVFLGEITPQEFADAMNATLATS